MITKTITYTDYNDESVTETLHFHLTKARLLDNLDLREELEALAQQFAGDRHSLSNAEIMEVLQLVKRFMKLSYGVRSADGKKFTQNDEVYNDFADSAAYDAVLFELFETPDTAMAFLAGVMPKDLMEAGRKAQAEREGVKRPMDRQQKQLKAVTPAQDTIEFSDEDVVEDSKGEPEETIEELEARLAAMREGKE